MNDETGITANGVRYEYKDLGVNPNNITVAQINGELYINGRKVRKSEGKETINRWDISLLVIALTCFIFAIVNNI
jgi:hypothetical protein